MQRQIDSPIMVLYTDGGARSQQHVLSVQLSFIALFLHQNLDMLEAVHSSLPVMEESMRVSKLHIELGPSSCRSCWHGAKVRECNFKFSLKEICDTL